MERKWVKKALIFLSQIVAVTVLLVGVSILRDGMYLIGVPDMGDVESVTVSYRGEGKESTDGEDIEQAVKLTGFLRYSLFEEAGASGEPLITITYHLKSGKDVDVSANRETVWWQGKAHAIKQKEMFVNLTEGIFFL